MNLVQRIVAENLQSVTSQELAEAAGMAHEELCQFLEEYRPEIEDKQPLQKTANGFVLTINQTFGAVIFMEMSDGFYEKEQATPEDKLKMELKHSFIKVLKTLLNATTKVKGVNV